MREEYRSGALYIRVSTNRQEELSPDAQKRLCLDYAKKNKIIIDPQYIFVENGISGRETKNRPEFQRMIGIAKSNPLPFDVILVWKFSRFARNREESIVYKSLLRKQRGIDVISVSEPLIEGPFGTLIESFIEWSDEYYSINLSQEVTRGMTEKALRGGYQSSPCLGYDAVGDGSPFVVNESDMEKVQMIFHYAHDDRMQPTQIARRLNDTGKHTRRGNPFDTRAIVRILRNRFYIGLVSWNGIEFEGAHETRISRELFDEVQEILDSQYKPARRRTISSCRHWLSGLLKCSTCGSSLAYNSKGFFNCWKYAKGLHHGSCSIIAFKAESAVFEYFERILDGEEFDFTYIPSGSDDHTLELEGYKKELDRLSVREQRIKLAYENEIDTLEEYRENKVRINAERERLQGLISSLVTAADVPTKESVLEKIKTVLDVIKSEDVNYEMKGNLMRSIVEEIIFDRETETFTFRLYSSD